MSLKSDILRELAQGPQTVKQLRGKLKTDGKKITKALKALEADGEVKGEKVYVLRFLQGRDPKWVDVPFFAKYDPKATWFDQLTPAFGEEKFFFETGTKFEQACNDSSFELFE